MQNLSIPGESDRFIEAAKRKLEAYQGRRDLWILLEATEIGTATEQDAYQRYIEARREVLRLIARGMTID